MDTSLARTAHIAMHEQDEAYSSLRRNTSVTTATIHAGLTLHLTATGGHAMAASGTIGGIKQNNQASSAPWAATHITYQPSTSCGNCNDTKPGLDKHVLTCAVLTVLLLEKAAHCPRHHRLA
jgi:hypothetical protein